MNDKQKLLLIGGGLAAIGGGIGLYALSRFSKGAGTSGGIIVNINGPSSASVGVKTPFWVQVYSGNVLTPLKNVNVSLYVNGSVYATQTTDQAGSTEFYVTFTSQGIYSVYAVYDGIKSDSINVAVSTVQCKCDEVFDPTSGECVPKIPNKLIVNIDNSMTSITPTFYYNSGSNYGLYFRCGKDCGSNLTYSIPGAYFKISGMVLDEYGNGICNKTVRVSPNITQNNPAKITMYFTFPSIAGAPVTYAATLDVFLPDSTNPLMAFTTDSNGYFSGYIYYQFNIDSMEIPNVVPPLPTNICASTEANVGAVLTATVDGYSNISDVQTVQSTIYGCYCFYVWGMPSIVPNCP